MVDGGLSTDSLHESLEVVSFHHMFIFHIYKAQPEIVNRKQGIVGTVLTSASCAQLLTLTFFLLICVVFRCTKNRAQCTGWKRGLFLEVSIHSAQVNHTPGVDLSGVTLR